MTDDAFFIHYSCGLFSEHRTPPISHIIIVTPAGTRVFGASQDEQAALCEFVSFIDLAHHNGDPTWVHWKMARAEWGFDAIKRRCTALGVNVAAFELLTSRLYDLADGVKAFDPDGYRAIPHPRLESLARINGVTSLNLLSEAERAKAWRNGEHHRLVLNTERRALIVRDLYELLCRDSLIFRPDAPTDDRNPLANVEVDRPLKPAMQKAWAAYQYVESHWDGLQDALTDRAAWEWLREHGPPEYKLPECDTFARYVRAARKVHGRRKNLPRAGRTGRSIVGVRELSDRPASD